MLGSEWRCAAEGERATAQMTADPLPHVESPYACFRAYAELAERLYGDFPAEERENAARALARVTAKANAEFADQ
ncbi:hypothetical protein [Streptacidiphilus albus]|nr:hypothetical protein [Streptacidiphilus albus]